MYRTSRDSEYLLRQVGCAEILSESNVCELLCLWQRQGSHSGVALPIPLTALSHPAVPCLAHGFTGNTVIMILHSSFQISPQTFWWGIKMQNQGRATEERCFNWYQSCGRKLCIPLTLHSNKCLNTLWKNTG